MIIAIAGSQGTGKGTVLAGLQEQGYTVIERKTSRSILDEWGVTLADVNGDPDLTIKFQNEITYRKALDEKEAAESDELILTERTHADLFTYALVALGMHNRFSKWLDEYYDLCKAYNTCYQHVIWIPAGVFPVQHDAVRGSNKHYSRMVDLAMHDITCEMISSDKMSYLTAVSVENRIQEAKQIIQRVS